MPDRISSDLIANLLDGECVNRDIIVDNFSSLASANNRSVTFFNDVKYKDDLLKTKAALVILKKEHSNLFGGASVYVDDPYLAFAKVASLFKKTKYFDHIHSSVVLGDNITLGSNVFIGPNVVLGQNVRIGDYCFIGANTFIGDDVSIGNNVDIHPNVYISNQVKIGNHCEFLSGAKIGTDGFGYAREKNKSWFKIPQTGSVVIGNNVDIGSNSTVDRGAIDNTVIEDGVKIDNLVQIGHNCLIGKNTIIAGCAGIAGSTKIGKNCMIGGAAMIKGHISIADDTIISGGTGIGKNVENPGKRFTNVFPYNLEHKDWLRIANSLKKMGKK